jgi:Regulator of ribonuclease activity B
LARRIDITEPLRREWSRWEEQKVVRLEHGDQLSADREVTHTILFTWRRHAMRAKTRIARSRGGRLTRTNGRQRWILEAIAEDDLDDESVRHSLEFMLTIAAACHGRYDGFGAPVVREN